MLETEIVRLVPPATCTTRVVAPLPSTPEEIRAFIGSSFSGMHQAGVGGEPHEDDSYLVSAHDLLEAFSEWAQMYGSAE